MTRVTQNSSTSRPRHKALTGATVTALGGVLALGLSACGTGAEDTTAATDSESTTTVTTEPEAPSDQSSTEQPASEQPPAEQSASESAPADSSTVTTPAAEESPGAIGPLGNPGTGDQWVRAEGPWQLMVTDVRVGTHGGFDRVVFDLEGQGTPGWFTTLTENPTQQASGLPLDYTGETALVVGIDGTPYPNETDMEAPQLGTTPGAGNVNEVSYTSIFEARTEFVIGLDEKMPYSVTFLDDPERLVIDFVHQ